MRSDQQKQKKDVARSSQLKFNTKSQSRRGGSGRTLSSGASCLDDEEGQEGAQAYRVRRDVSSIFCFFILWSLRIETQRLVLATSGALWSK